MCVGALLRTHVCLCACTGCPGDWRRDNDKNQPELSERIDQTGRLTNASTSLDFGDDVVDVSEVSEGVDMSALRVAGHSSQLVHIVATHPDREHRHARLLDTVNRAMLTMMTEDSDHGNDNNDVRRQ